MAQAKVAPLVNAKKLLQQAGEGVTSAFLGRLSAEDQELYENLLPTMWVPIEQVSRMVKLAAELLLINDPEGLEKLGQIQARRDLSTVYKLFVAVSSVSFVVKQAGKMWNTYHQKGSVQVQKDPDRNRILFVVEDYEDMPMEFAKLLTGWILGLAEMTGIRNTNRLALGMSITFCVLVGLLALRLHHLHKAKKQAAM